MPTLWINAWDAISAQLAGAPSILVACDFDGTISQIVPQPWDAALLPRAKAALASLAEKSGVTVAIVSGRELADIARRAEIPGAVYSGNHGLEFRGLGLDETTLDGETVAAWMRDIATLASENLSGVPGIMVENKGLTVSIHYRNVPAEFWEQVEKAANSALVVAPETELHHGNMVWEIKPKTGMNKGTAVISMCEKLGIPTSAVIFVGDDTTDETAFAALPDGITILVGSALETSARWLARDPEDVANFLEWLAARRKR